MQPGPPKFFQLRWQLTIFGLLLVASIFLSYQKDWELGIMEFFYNRPKDFWQIHEFSGFVLVYQYFPFATIAVFTIGLSLFLYGRFVARQCSPKRVLLVLFALLLNAGLVELLKGLITRTRPYDQQFFGALYDYLPIGFTYYIKDGIHFSSFPSGHASSGFSLTILFYLFWPWKRSWAYTSYVLAWGMGIMLMLTRLLQGGHYLSDLLFSLALAQLINSLIGFYLVHNHQGSNGLFDCLMPTKPSSKIFQPGLVLKISSFTVIFSLWIIVVCGFLLSFFQSVHENFSFEVKALPVVSKFDENSPERLEFRQGSDEKLHLLFLGSAKGFPWQGLHPVILWEQKADSSTPMLKVAIGKGFSSHTFDGFIRVYWPKKP